MIAVDTNIVVRLLTADEPRQAARARALFESEAVYIAKSVLLESEWVLRSGYGFASDTIAAALRAILGLAGVTVEDPSAMRVALARYEGGLDFADALHLASLGGASKFATFDRRLAKRAAALDGAPEVEEP